MPIYDYACTECGRVVEVVHGVNGHGPEACATCGGAMKKLLSTPAVHFKGSGWAKKDRGANSATKAAARSTSSGDDSSHGGTADATKSQTATAKTDTGEAAGSASTATDAV